MEKKSMKKNNYVAIMAGGIGSRFWPMSRTDFPKQFLDILKQGRTLSSLPMIGLHTLFLKKIFML